MRRSGVKLLDSPRIVNFCPNIIRFHLHMEAILENGDTSSFEVSFDKLLMSVDRSYRLKPYGRRKQNMDGCMYNSPPAPGEPSFFPSLL